MMFKNISFRQIIASFCSMAMFLYFVYHIFQGDRGVIALMRIQKNVDMLENKRNDLLRQKGQLERNVYLLRPDSLDTDLLEERARAVLHFAHPSEVVIKNERVGRKSSGS